MKRLILFGAISALLTFSLPAADSSPKTDLAGAAGFDRETALSNIRRAAPEAEVFEVSARTSQGLDLWYDYLQRQTCHVRR